MNDVKLIGRLANDPELSYTTGGSAVAHFDLAVPKKTSDKNAPPDFFPITCWNHTAEFANKYLTKGRQIAVNGHLGTNKWPDKYGQNRKDITITADNIEPLGSAKNRDNSGGGQPAGGYDNDFDGGYYDGGGYEGP